MDESNIGCTFIELGHSFSTHSLTVFSPVSELDVSKLVLSMKLDVLLRAISSG